jgi:hypothetical protein
MLRGQTKLMNYEPISLNTVCVCVCVCVCNEVVVPEGAAGVSISDLVYYLNFHLS